MTALRCVLVGSGSIGRRHARALRALEPSSELIALRSGRGAALPPGFADREVHNVRDALALKPDCVIVADPATAHAASAIPFIEAGVAVLIEKPLAANAGEAQALQVAAAKNPRVLVGYVLRHDVGLAAFREALQSGAVGKLITLHLEAGQSLSTWRPGTDAATSISARPETAGGVLFELSHEIDSARWLLGELTLLSAAAATAGDLPLGVEDSAIVVLRDSRGSLALVQIDMARGKSVRRYRAVGTAGTLEWAAEDGAVRLQLSDRMRIIQAEQRDRDELYCRQMAHFLSVVRGEMPPLCTLDDGALTLAAVLGARAQAGLDGPRA